MSTHLLLFLSSSIVKIQYERGVNDRLRVSITYSQAYSDLLAIPISLLALMMILLVIKSFLLAVTTSLLAVAPLLLAIASVYYCPNAQPIF
ncbi:hypothetical protein [Bacillus sp. SD088]|uniref:hypothetical protein n=1 Tax=Bacillus sp. SD088 TaxID=2782012 RepID=UPI001A97C690|nr:hypothetical protein [Bacillus sp. SD088]MBO0995061.1 hypothetical protein [Bacillus sp. SD088]